MAGKSENLPPYNPEAPPLGEHPQTLSNPPAYAPPSYPGQPPYVGEQYPAVQLYPPAAAYSAVQHQTLAPSPSATKIACQVPGCNYVVENDSENVALAMYNSHQIGHQTTPIELGTVPQDGSMGDNPNATALLVGGSLYHVGNRRRMWVPAELSCPHCKQFIKTECTYEKPCRTYCTFIMFLFVCPLQFCIPCGNRYLCTM